MPAIAGSFKVSIVVYPETDRRTGAVAWIAQCLEYDIMSQGKSINQAQERLERKIAATLVMCLERGKEAFEEMRPAPQRFWEMYKSAPQQLIKEENPIRTPMPLPAIHPTVKLIEDWAA